MPFFAPLMLFGLVAALAPIIIHLFRRRTARRIPWGAWQFLAESMRRKRRRILLEELVLMAVRILLLALAALAFARPYLPETGFFGGGEKDVVIVLDRSGSMNLMRRDGTTAFEAAVAEARELVRQAPRGVSFGLVLGGRDAEILTATPFSSRREMLKLLDDVKPGDETMDVPRVLEAAGGVLSGGSRPNKEIVLFSDGQGYGWRTDDANAWRRVGAVLDSFTPRPPVVLRVLDRPESVRNAAIASIVPSREIFGTDRPLTFAVTVVNSGSVAFSPGELSLSVDGRRIASQPVGQVLPGLSRTIPLSCSFKATGPHAVVAALGAGDDIAADNAVTNEVRVIDELKVLLVNGHPDADGFDRPTAYLEAALRPETKDAGIPFLVRPKSVRPAELESTNVFADVAVTILCDVPFLSEKAADNLARWTAEGGGLVAVPGERADLGFYTNWQWRAKAVMPACWTQFSRTPGGERPPTFEGAPVAGRMLFDESKLVTNDLEVVSRMDDGRAAVVTGVFGKGRVGLLAMPLDLDWTGLPARAAFVPFVHGLVYSHTGRKSFSAADGLGWSANEGNVTPLGDEEVGAIAPHVALSFARLRDDVRAAVAGRSFGVEIWRPLAIAVLILMLVELLLSRVIDRARAGEGHPPRASVLRAALRALAVLSVVWMLAHVVLVYDRTRKVSRKVALVVDVSQSMRRYGFIGRAATNVLSRLDIATNAAARLEAALGAKYDIESYSFGGEVTDFAAALEEVRARVPPEELAGALFVTDGRPTGGADVESVARLYARQGARISSVIVGSTATPSDVAIENVEAPDGLFLGDKVHAQVLLRADGFKGEKIVVKFNLGVTTLESRELEIDSPAWSKELRFTDEPKERGVYSYRIVVETPDRDAEAANDDWPFDVAVSDDRTNVLVADRRPRWEFRYLRNLFFGRDKSVHLQYLLSEPDRLEGGEPAASQPADATREFGDAEAGRLPKGLDGWRKFDVIVIGDLAPESLPDEEVAHLRACVEERGATLVFIAGERYLPLAYAESPLADLLPVSITNSTGAVSASWRSGAYPFAVTGSGFAHEILSLSASEAENAHIWSSGCDWYRRLDGLSAKPGAETLAFAGDSDALKNPLLVVQGRGRGKVAFLASAETWRFRYRIGDTYHHRFWGNLLRWGTGVKLRDGNRFARIGTDRVHYAPGEKVKIRLRLSDADSLPLEGMPIQCFALGPRGRKTSVVISSRPDANGSYEGAFDETWECGDYLVEATCEKARRLLGEKWPDHLATGFSVKKSFAPLEFAHSSCDRALADEMAKLTEGQVVELNATTNALSALKLSAFDAFGVGRSEVVDHVERSIWDHPLAFVVLAAAMIVLWILRKKRGLS